MAVSSFYICRSVLAGDITAAACGTDAIADTEVEIKVAWKVKNGSDCLDGGTTGTCTYKLRTRL